jgi:type I restriction enzyme S subunit
MGLGWLEYTLGDLCKFKYGHMPRKTDLCDDGYPVFSGYHVVGHATTYHYEEPEIIVVARGVGGTGDVKMSPPKCFLTNLSIVAQVVSSEVDKKFLYYRLAGPKLWELRTGSAQAQITIDRLQRYELRLPPLPTQRKIAAILSAYDNLIENNLRRIKILEEMAQNLYREWFVKFRFPGYQQGRFTDSPLGRIPEGWEVDTVERTFAIFGGGTPSRTVPGYWNEGTINWYSPTDLTATGSMFMDRSGDKISELGLAKSSARSFPPFSVMMTSRATLGVISINTTDACTNQGFITCVPNERFPLYTLYYWLKENVEYFISLGTGSTFKEITKGVFKTIELVIPAPVIVTQFEGTVQQFALQVLNLQRKNTTLRRTRDLLLPRLISGEVDVSELDIAVPDEAGI